VDRISSISFFERPFFFNSFNLFDPVDSGWDEFLEESIDGFFFDIGTLSSAKKALRGSCSKFQFADGTA